MHVINKETGKLQLVAPFTGELSPGFIEVEEGKLITITLQTGEVICGTIYTIFNNKVAILKNSKAHTHFFNEFVVITYDDQQITPMPDVPPVAPPTCSKFDKLMNVWKLESSQIHNNIKLVNFMRLVDGDLSHIGDVILDGEFVVNLNNNDHALIFAGEASQYTIKPKTITLNNKWLDYLLNHPHLKDELKQKIRNQL